MRSHIKAFGHALIIGAVTVTSLATLGLAVACSDSTAPASHTVYGAAQPLGQGMARTYVVIDADGEPTTIGVALSETAMQGLPMTPMAGMPMAATMNLALPTEARAAGYDHATLDWNPNGHDPEVIYGAPHFDFHFYTITEGAQAAMTPADPQFDAKLAKAPPAQYRPATYIQLPGGVPMMGSHWADPASPELAPNAPAGTFTRTFLYGSYDGHFVFYEPMITKTTLEGTRTQSAAAATRDIRIPAQYEAPGNYPTSYTVAYDAIAKEYHVAIDGLVRR